MRSFKYLSGIWERSDQSWSSEVDPVLEKNSDLSIPTIHVGMELAPFQPACGWVVVAKASQGHFPLPFLISFWKNWIKCKKKFITLQI